VPADQLKLMLCLIMGKWYKSKMQKSHRLAFLIWPLVVAVLIARCSGAQSLPNDWWLQNSPEKVLEKAQAINQDLGFFHGEKFGPTLLQNINPFAKTNDNARMEFFQRRNADGFVETKRFQLDGKFQWTDYRLKSGNYVFAFGQLIKMEYEINDGDGPDVEKSTAAKFDHPYDFKILKSEMVGTNDCMVIARCMTPKFLDAMKAILYKNYSKEQEDAFAGGDFRKFIRSETDYYFRKSDGVTFGLTKRNHLGEQIEDWVYNNVEINQPIPDSEFSLPKGKIKIAKTPEEFSKIQHDAFAAMRAKTPKNPAATPTPSPVEIKVEKRVSELPWATDLPKALEQAKAENKIVLLDFTGSDWCIWCMKFDNDVLSKPEFSAFAKTNLVMVLLDFPNAKKQSDALKKTNQELQAKFKVDGFPTYVALTPDGKEIGRQVGYLAGGPQAFIVELEKFRKQ
jgi:thioredoxin-related protein